MNIARVLFDTLAHVRPVWRGTVPGSRETRGLCHSHAEAEMLFKSEQLTQIWQVFLPLTNKQSQCWAECYLWERGAVLISFNLLLLNTDTINDLQEHHYITFQLARAQCLLIKCTHFLQTHLETTVVYSQVIIISISFNIFTPTFIHTQRKAFFFFSSNLQKGDD